MNRLLTIKTLLSPALMLILTIGCDDQRAVELAREAANRQAEQNETMAALNKEVASGTKRLVEFDAEARREIVGVHRELQAERTRLDSGWTALEGERQAISRDRRTESLIVPAATILGGVLLVALVLGFCWSALTAASREDVVAAEVSALLVSELLPHELPHITRSDQAQPLLGETAGPDSR